MGKPQKQLQSLLSTELREMLDRPARHRLKAAGLEPEVMKVYHQLGGSLEAYPDGCGAYDVVYQGLAVGLDEERHFNGSFCS